MLFRSNKYKEFTTYATYVLNLSSDVTDFDVKNSALKYEKLSVCTSEMRWNRDHLILNREDFFRKLDEAIAEKDEATKLQSLYGCVQTLAASAAKKFWEAGQPQGLRYTGNYRYVCTPSTFTKFFYELLRFEFSGELFDEQEMPKGKVVVDTNEKYLQF